MPPDIELMLPARAENVAVVRHALGALGDIGALDDQMLADVRLATSEACANVVVHAYPEGADGPLEVEAGIGDDRLEVTVRDHGGGIAPAGHGSGLGLALIGALADTMHLGRDEQARTEVRMTFALARPGSAPHAGESPRPEGGVA
jgi:anti-sigma regulatory factor (Ser/Thr protein kinase)